MRKQSKKLCLARETLHSLSRGQRIAGGATDLTNCGTCTACGGCTDTVCNLNTCHGTCIATIHTCPP
jgi:hypothetical protein